MKITASLVCDTSDENKALWSLPLAGTNILDYILHTLQHLSILDDVCIFTNDQVLTGAPDYKGVAVHPFSERLAYNFNFLDNIKLHNECFTLIQSQFLGDVHLFLDIHYPLLQLNSLDCMFHALMENRFAAKIIPVYSIDPHLYIELPEPGQYINLWGQPGLDRQKHPPLFRAVGSCFLHCIRLREIQPLTFPYEVNRIEGFTLSTAQDIDFIHYVLNKTDALNWAGEGWER